MECARNSDTEQPASDFNDPMVSILRDINTIESVVDAHVHSGASKSVEAASAPPLVTPRYNSIEDQSLEPLRELCDELLVRSNALRQENESLVKEMRELREELALAREALAKRSPSLDEAQRHNGDSPDLKQNPPPGDLSVASETLGHVVDRIVASPDAKRAVQWVHQAQLSQPQLSCTIDVKDGLLMMSMAPAKKHTALLRRTNGGPSTAAGASRNRPTSHAPGVVSGGLGIHASGPLVVGNPRAVPQRQSVTPTITRARALTPVRATTAGGSTANSRAASPGISTTTVTAATALKSRSPVVSRNSVSSTSTVRRAPTPSTAGPVRSTTPVVAQRKPSGAIGSGASHPSAVAATTVPSATLQQCGMMLRKGSGGVSRRANGPPTIQKKTISASPPRENNVQESIKEHPTESIVAESPAAVAPPVATTDSDQAETLPPV